MSKLKKHPVKDTDSFQPKLKLGSLSKNKANYNQSKGAE
jgi:hypothetical protein